MDEKAYSKVLRIWKVYSAVTIKGIVPHSWVLNLIPIRILENEKEVNERDEMEQKTGHSISFAVSSLISFSVYLYQSRNKQPRKVAYSRREFKKS